MLGKPYSSTNSPSTMNELINNDRRYTIETGEISVSNLSCSSSTSLSSSFGCSSSTPPTNHDPTKPMSNDIQSQTESISPLLGHRWRVEDKDVKNIPKIYPRLTCPLILRDRDVSEIGDRLWAFFSAHDVRTVYDRNQGRLLCGTERVGFVVQFWRRKSSNNNSSTGSSQSAEEIILEIQRRKGCSWAMQKIRSALKKSLLLQKQSSQSEPNLRRDRLSSTMKRSFFPPPPQRFNHHNAVGTIKPLLLPHRFQPLSRSETEKHESSTTGKPSPTRQTSWNGSQQRLREKPDLPPAIGSISAIRDPFSYSFPPPLRQYSFRTHM